jgi:hypothetical protein
MPYAMSKWSPHAGVLITINGVYNLSKRDMPAAGSDAANTSFTVGDSSGQAPTAVRDGCEGDDLSLQSVVHEGQGEGQVLLQPQHQHQREQPQHQREQYQPGEVADMAVPRGPPCAASDAPGAGAEELDLPSPPTSDVPSIIIPPVYHRKSRQVPRTASRSSPGGAEGPRKDSPGLGVSLARGIGSIAEEGSEPVATPAGKDGYTLFVDEEREQSE